MPLPAGSVRVGPIWPLVDPFLAGATRQPRDPLVTRVRPGSRGIRRRLRCGRHAGPVAPIGSGRDPRSGRMDRCEMLVSPVGRTRTEPPVEPAPPLGATDRSPARFHPFPPPPRLTPLKPAPMGNQVAKAEIGTGKMEAAPVGAGKMEADPIGAGVGTDATQISDRGGAAGDHVLPAQGARGGVARPGDHQAARSLGPLHCCGLRARSPTCRSQSECPCKPTLLTALHLVLGVSS